MLIKKIVITLLFSYKIKLPITSMASSDSLLRTDSLSSTDPVLSDGSVGSAPSLGLSPGPTTSVDMNRIDMNRNEMSCGQEKMKQKSQEVSLSLQKNLVNVEI